MILEIVSESEEMIRGKGTLSQNAFLGSLTVPSRRCAHFLYSGDVLHSVGIT